MENLIVNYKNHTIEMTKSFEKHASIVGSEAYNKLVEARKEFPSYKLVIKKPAKRSSVCVDYTFMESYIASHEDAENNLANFNKLREMNVSYLEIKDWFVKTYPQFQNLKTRVEWYLAA